MNDERYELGLWWRVTLGPLIATLHIGVLYVLLTVTQGMFAFGTFQDQLQSVYGLWVFFAVLLFLSGFRKKRIIVGRYYGLAYFNDPVFYYQCGAAFYVVEWFLFHDAAVGTFFPVLYFSCLFLLIVWPLIIGLRYTLIALLPKIGTRVNQ